MRTFYILCIGLLFFSNLSFAQNKYAAIGATDVKMRKAATTSSELIGTFQMGQIAEILDKTEKTYHIPGIGVSSCNEYFWYKLKIRDQVGWVFGAFVFEQVEQSNLCIKIEEGDTDMPVLGVAYMFWNSVYGSDGCQGDNFIAFVKSEQLNAYQSASIIKMDKPRNYDYRGMPSIGTASVSIKDIIYRDDKMTLFYMGNNADEYTTLRVIELRKEGDQYRAKELYYETSR